MYASVHEYCIRQGKVQKTCHYSHVNKILSQAAHYNFFSIYYISYLCVQCASAYFYAMDRMHGKPSLQNQQRVYNRVSEDKVNVKVEVNFVVRYLRHILCPDVIWENWKILLNYNKKILYLADPHKVFQSQCRCFQNTSNYVISVPRSTALIDFS